MPVLQSASCETHGISLQAADVSEFQKEHQKCGKAPAAKPEADKAKPRTRKKS